MTPDPSSAKTSIQSSREWEVQDIIDALSLLLVFNDGLDALLVCTSELIAAEKRARRTTEEIKKDVGQPWGACPNRYARPKPNKSNRNSKDAGGCIQVVRRAGSTAQKMVNWQKKSCAVFHVRQFLSVSLLLAQATI